jgi:integrase
LEDKLSFSRVLDTRKNPIRGLWKRGSRFYARINVDGVDKRLPLNAETIKTAKEELNQLRTQRAQNTLEEPERAPRFRETMEAYLTHASLTKRSRTVETERIHLQHLLRFLGAIKLDHISTEAVVRYRTEKLRTGWSKRTCNLSITVLRNLIKFAIETGALRQMPFQRICDLKHVPGRKRLVKWDEIERICDAAVTETKNGQQFSDYLKLMSLSGGRRDETLRLRWTDVDCERRQITIGSDGLAKNHESRVVDFSTSLEAHLSEMQSRRVAEKEWLFRSARSKDGRFHTFNETLRIARAAAGITDFGFHHCRVFFASQCVMAGIDFRTIATWLGHKDGGVLLSRVYARLSDQHKRNMANRLVIGASQGDPEGTTPPLPAAQP